MKSRCRHLRRARSSSGYVPMLGVSRGSDLANGSGSSGRPKWLTWVSSSSNLWSTSVVDTLSTLDRVTGPCWTPDLATSLVPNLDAESDSIGHQGDLTDLERLREMAPMPLRA
ncbi:hypothetical protein U1Q18_027223, partial [Sarracenia purpurea var. burkii]